MQVTCASHSLEIVFYNLDLADTRRNSMVYCYYEIMLLSPLEQYIHAHMVPSDICSVHTETQCIYYENTNMRIDIDIFTPLSFVLDAAKEQKF